MKDEKIPSTLPNFVTTVTVTPALLFSISFTFWWLEDLTSNLLS